MKTKLFFLAFALLSARAYCQSKNSLSLVYGVNANSVDIHGVKGDFGYNDKSGVKYGLAFTRNLNHWFSVESGLVFSVNKAQETYIREIFNQNGPVGIASVTDNGDIKIISVPLLAKFTFFKYLYADAGLTADFETNYSYNSIASNQSGIGCEMGIGSKYNIGHVSIFVNPFLSAHGIIMFNSKSSYSLLEAGAKLGVGYSF